MAKQTASEAFKRVSTGIATLDSLLQGGFLPGRSYLVTGDAGTGKTTACMQFLKSGLEQEEKAVYVTVDERPAEILQAAESLGWDLQQYVQAKSFAILDASPLFQRSSRNRRGQGRRSAEDCLGSRKLRKEVGGDTTGD